MGDVTARLESKIRRLKADALARNTWRRVRIMIEQKGRTWRADNGITFKLLNGVIFQYMSDPKEGVSNLLITAIDAPVPYVASLNIDLQGTPLAKREGILKELEEMVSKRKTPIKDAEIVVIVEGDWLSKISLARWGTMDWKRHLIPTKMTLDARKNRGTKFDPDLIYPGDTFEVVT